jgi:glutathione synthase/RimK-type ligase-like ATP-grasp enzyme
MDDITPLGFPLILKIPDGTFSAAVKKAEGAEAFDEIRQEMFRRSPLLIVQEFTPTPFDWRIGVLDGRLLFAAKYHMVKDHWQIVGRWKTGRARFGRVEAVPIDAAPTAVTELAVEAAGLIGDGLYGVDIKESPNGPLVIEVNDNPNLVETDEDAVERDRLYEAVILTLLRRIKAPQGPPTT